MTDLFDEIEVRLRKIIREEVGNALTRAQNSTDDFYRPGVQRSLPHLLTANELGEYLGMNVQGIYQLARESKMNGFPVIRLGIKSLRFSPTEVQKWLNERQNIKETDKID